MRWRWWWRLCWWWWRDASSSGVGIAAGALVAAVVVLVVLSRRPYVVPDGLKEEVSALREEHRRVLVGMTVGEKCKERVSAMIEEWGHDLFNYLLFVYDGSDWSRLAALDGVDVFSHKALKMYHYKAHVPPERVDNFDFFLLLDCDVGLEGFDINHFLAIQQAFEIPLAQPSVEWGALTDRSSDHRICRTVSGPHFGRWTNFVECGPFVSFTAEAYRCIYELIQGDLGSGWGLDYKWCAFLRDQCRIRPAKVGAIRTNDNDGGRVCAVIDAEIVQHLDERTAFGLLGSGYKVFFLNVSSVSMSGHPIAYFNIQRCNILVIFTYS